MPDSFPVQPPSNDNPFLVDGVDGGIIDGDNDEGDSMMVGEGDEADGLCTEASQATGADLLLNQGIMPRTHPINVPLLAPTTLASPHFPSTP